MPDAPTIPDTEPARRAIYAIRDSWISVAAGLADAEESLKAAGGVLRGDQRWPAGDPAWIDLADLALGRAEAAAGELRAKVVAAREQAGKLRGSG